MDKTEARQCSYTIVDEASRLGRWVVDRHQCRMRTKHKSGRCHLHRNSSED